MSDLRKTDFTQRFIFDNSDTRGELVSLDHSYAEVLAKHAYPEPVQQLLGELMAAAALLVSTLKFDGLMSLQARSEGAVPLLMIEITSEHEIRGLARFDADQITPDATLSDLMPNGVLALTIDPTIGKRYQGIVDLGGNDLSACFTNYFVMSHQVPTRFWLAADGKRARGMLLQQLPAEVIKDEVDRAESWNRLNALGDTLKVEELLGLDVGYLVAEVDDEGALGADGGEGIGGLGEVHVGGMGTDAQGVDYGEVDAAAEVDGGGG